MKLFFTFLFFSIFFTLSYSQPLEFFDLPVIDLTSVNTVVNHHDDHGSMSTVVDRVTQDRPSEVIGDSNKPKVITRFDLHYFGKNQGPVRLSNRFPFHQTTFRFFPRRCNHDGPNHRFIPEGEMGQNVVQFMFKKEETMEKEMKTETEKDKRVVPRGRNGGPFSDISVPRHVARKDEAEMNMMMFSRPRLPLRHVEPHHHHDNRAHDDQKMGEKHDDRSDGLIKEKGDEVIYKIRKFLNYF